MVRALSRHALPMPVGQIAFAESLGLDDAGFPNTDEALSFPL